MPALDVLHLMRVLGGLRIRAGGRHWIVKDTFIQRNRLFLDVGVNDNAMWIAFDLPESFDGRSGQHMGWLLEEIEQRLRACDQ